MKTKRRLTPKQQAFCDYYIETGNATEAYKRAGYSVRSDNAAGVEGHKLLRNPKIKQYIAERMAEKEEERIASQDEVLEFLTKVMRGEVTEETPIIMKDKWVMTDKEPSIRERVKAAEQLGKRYALWTDKQEVEVITPIFIEDVPNED